MAEGDASFDVVVVGAGPAGSACALVLARSGRRVCLVERGPFPGSKNVYGGVIYGRVLDDLLPDWRDQAPIERWITRRATMVLTETQSLSVDFRSNAWGGPPHNGATAYRPAFDAWLAAQAVDAGAVLCTSTTVTGLVGGRGAPVTGVLTDRQEAIDARAVVACDGVNALLAKEAGLYRDVDPANYSLGAKEVLRLDPAVIEERFGLDPGCGADFEILGGTGIPGGGFLYTNRDTLAVGVVAHLPGLTASAKRPEAAIAALKAHPAIAPLVAGGDLVEYSAHLLPEGGLSMIPTLAADGLLVAGDAAGLCLAAGIWLEGVNYAVASGVCAAETLDEALTCGDLSKRGLAGYRRRLRSTFVLKDHRRLRRVPHLVLSDRFQSHYPKLLCDVAEAMLDVDNPAPKPRLVRLLRREARRNGIRPRHLVADGWRALRSFG